MSPFVSAPIIVAIVVMLCGCGLLHTQKRTGTPTPREWQEMDQARAREAALMREMWSSRSRP